MPIIAWYPFKRRSAPGSAPPTLGVGPPFGGALFIVDTSRYPEGAPSNAVAYARLVFFGVIRAFFIRVGGAEQEAFGEKRRRELQAQRHLVLTVVGAHPTAGQRERRQPRQRDRYRVVIHQVHAVRIAFRAVTKGGRC